MSIRGKQSFIQGLRKSVMGRLRPLAVDERVDYAQLVAQGIPPAEARAIAQGYSSINKAQASVSDSYLRAYHKAAKKHLPDWQHGILHKAARGPAVSMGKQDARARRDESKQAFIAELDALKARIKVVQAEIGKSSPLASEVHVPVPLGGKGKKKGLIVKRQGGIEPDGTEMAFIQAAYNMHTPVPPRSMDDGYADNALAPLMQANRLVQGMDQELIAGCDVEVARRRASRIIEEQPGHYKSVGVPTEVRDLHGLMIDLGSGTQRLEGHLGLDVFAYDHGTVLHDVTMGLPFPEGSVRHVSINRAMADLCQGEDEVLMRGRLLDACQRVLMEGGVLDYQDAAPLVDPNTDFALPGLVLLASEPMDGLICQRLKRVPVRSPGYHGADSNYAPAPPMPLDMQLALAALNTSPAGLAMANLIHKAESQIIPIAKADKMRQIVSGVVLSPFSEDTQGDVMMPEDIERSAHHYMMQSRVIGSEHGRPIDAGVVESYIAPQDLQFSGLDNEQTFVPKGSWVLSVKISDPAEWEAVLAGMYTGFSVGGLGTRSEQADAA